MLAVLSAAIVHVTLLVVAVSAIRATSALRECSDSLRRIRQGLEGGGERPRIDWSGRE